MDKNRRFWEADQGREKEAVTTNTGGGGAEGNREKMSACASERECVSVLRAVATRQRREGVSQGDKEKRKTHQTVTQTDGSMIAQQGLVQGNSAYCKQQTRVS